MPSLDKNVIVTVVFVLLVLVAICVAWTILLVSATETGAAGAVLEMYLSADT